MLILQNPTHLFFSFPKTLHQTPKFHQHQHQHQHHTTLLLKPLKAYSADEFPVDETFLEKFAPKDEETEDEHRVKNWVERGWAPWEEVLSPEADFARKSLNEGEEVPLQTPEAIEAFKMLSPKYREQKMREMGLTEDDWYRRQFDMKNVPEKLETFWNGGLVLTHVAPRDWPPRGWEVDRKELEYIRGGHKIVGQRVSLEDLESGSLSLEEKEEACWDRYKVFVKQYEEWVDANKDRLEEESYEQDQDYCAGRRKRGKDYKEDMYELPFYYPGQICEGKVTTLHLYQGAFVDIGGVYEGWVPIKGNDWYWIRHHIKVGMHCIVEVLAKRDPYWFRFPIELRFVFPNIDHLIFNRFEYPPIFHREEGSNKDELRRYCGRPPVPRRELETNPVEESLLSNHPYVDKLWEINAAEQMILDDWETNPEKYKGKKLSELTDGEDFDEQNNVEYCKVKYKKSTLDHVMIKQSVKELDMEAALAERKLHIKLRKEAEARGEEYKISHLRRNLEMDEYDLLHWRRSFEERETLLRDISCRKALGLPLEEPGRYKPVSFFGKDQYDPENPLYRYDYWGEPKNSEKSKQQRMTDIHNKSIVGKGAVWYEMPYEEVMKQKEKREARMKLEKQNEVEEPSKDEDSSSDYDDDLDFDYSIFGTLDGELSDQPLVNGTESSSLSDEGMFMN